MWCAAILQRVIHSILSFRHGMEKGYPICALGGWRSTEYFIQELSSLWSISDELLVVPQL